MSAVALRPIIPSPNPAVAGAANRIVDSISELMLGLDYPDRFDVLCYILLTSHRRVLEVDEAVADYLVGWSMP